MSEFKAKGCTDDSILHDRSDDNFVEAVSKWRNSDNAEVLKGRIKQLEQRNKELEAQVKCANEAGKKISGYLSGYQKAIKDIDDYFQYSNESMRDRMKVHKIFMELTNALTLTNKEG